MAVKSYNADSEIGRLSRDQEWLRYAVTVVVIVLAIGFLTLLFALATLIIDGYRSKESSYQNLSERVIEQNYKIDNITRQLDKFNQNPTSNTIAPSQ